MDIIKILLLMFFSVLLTSDLRADSKEEINKLVAEYRKGMVCVNGGTYLMGDVYRKAGSFTAAVVMGDGKVHKTPNTAGVCDTSYSAFAKGPHKVKLSSFCMHEREVTFKEHDIYSKATGKKRVYDSNTLIEEYKKTKDYEREVKSKHRWSDNPKESIKWMLEDRRKRYSRDRLPDLPAEVPNWHAANGFCEWLAKESGLPYDLPTEAQWEYVASNKGKNRGCNATSDGNSDPGVNVVSKTRLDQPKPKEFPPNPLGFYDLGGGLKEYMKDKVISHKGKKSQYPISLEIDPQGDSGGKDVIRRGPSYGNSNLHKSYFNRTYDDPNKSDRTLFTGFRCALNIKTKDAK